MSAMRVQRLEDFITWWRSHIKGDEKGEAQVFLDRFLKACGHEGALESGGLFERRIRRERDGKAHTAFADYVLNGTVLIEMKKRGENLESHYVQLEDYWKNLANKPRYAILCDFDELWIYDFPTQFYVPVDRVPIADLIDRQAALEFLFKGSNKTPIFQDNRVDITQKAAESLGNLFRSLTNRAVDSVDRPVAQHYVMQCMIALYAEDIGLMPPATFTRVVQACIDNQENTYDSLGLLFAVMNQHYRRAGRFWDVPYFNGGIFRNVVFLPLNNTELQALYDATRENWAKINPAIFGRVFEASLEKNERHKSGAHYTSEQDIKRIIDPVIVVPWQAQMDNANTVDDLIGLHQVLCDYRVLDPACGSGNFLFVAYREMKGLEHQILEKIARLNGNYSPTRLVSVKQFYGIDINPFAVELAKVTMMIAKKVAIDRYQTNEKALPLDDLDANIREGDALFLDWEQADAIVGNPPYIAGTHKVTEYGRAYVEALQLEFPNVHGRADYCVYWLLKAHETLKENGRAGMVCTNTITQNHSRESGLDFIVANGGVIYDAVSSMPWSGEAVVHVSIVNWSKGVPPYMPILWVYNEKALGDKKLIENPIAQINTSLSLRTDVKTAKILQCNTIPQKAFQGQTPGSTSSFTLSPTEAKKLIKQSSRNQEVLFPYMIGDELLGQNQGIPTRYIINFQERDIQQARAYGAVFKRLQAKIQPIVEANAEREAEINRQAQQENPTSRSQTGAQFILSRWWLHVRSRPEMVNTLKPLKRCIVQSRVAKRNILDFASTEFCLGDSLKIFAFDDDYTFGILQSNLNWQWTTRKSSTLKGDIRNTTTTTYDTFPFPQEMNAKKVKAVADAGRALHEYRRQVMRRDTTMTLRELYRVLELPGKNPLKDLHAQLDKAVLQAYGFDEKQEVLEQLLDLNLQVANRLEQGLHVTAPGIPSSYPNPSDLISTGCITLDTDES
jgi:SAM-dependent methyltransferase